jgi:MoaA/NifB/PqqE/SkfB family radical SAM enzyme
MLTAIEQQKREGLRLVKPRVYEKVCKFDEKIARGESIAIIQLQYDYACNMRCRHCSVSSFQATKNKYNLTPEGVKMLCKQADELGLAHVDLTGGEPLVFPDLDKVVEAIDPNKFYIQVDTNGWLMNKKNAKHLKDIGVDKIQLSLDNLNEEEHDDFRRRKGSYARALQSIDAIKEAGLSLQVATVVTHQRIHSEEFIKFLEFAKNRGVAVSVVFPKFVGEWEGRFDLMVTHEDIEYIHELGKEYNVYDHLTPGYGMDLGCIAVKRMISVLKNGDVLPCIWMYFSLGNIFEDRLEDILKKGMRYFGKYQPLCLASESKEFIDKYISKTYKYKQLPVKIEEIMEGCKYEI